MTTLTVDAADATVTLRLGAVDQLLSFVGATSRFPIGSVTGLEVLADAAVALPGLFTNRVGLSGFGARVGRFWRAGRREFWDVRGHGPGLRIECDREAGAPFDVIVLRTERAGELAESLRREIPGL